MFPCEFCEISKETYFTEDLQTTASVFFQKKYVWMCSVKACSEKFLKTYEEPLMKDLARIITKKKLHGYCFPVNLANFIKTTILQNNFDVLLPISLSTLYPRYK